MSDGSCSACYLWRYRPDVRAAWGGDPAECEPEPKGLGSATVSFRHGLGDSVNFAHSIPLYTRRGHKVRVHPGYADHAPIFAAAGAEVLAQRPGGCDSCIHPWHEPGRPSPRTETWERNKNGVNLSRSPMPFIGQGDLWDEYAAVRLDFSGQVTDADRRWAEDALRHAQPPVIILHVQGFTGTPDQRGRHYPPAATAELQRLLVERTGATVVVLDRDDHMHKSGLPGVIHVRDFGPGQLHELLRRVAVFAGVDSGPLHFARFLDTPTVGIWLNHYPADYALPPRPNMTHVVASRHAARDAIDGAKWNTRLALDDGPSPAFVADVICERLRDVTKLQAAPPLEPKREPLPMIERHHATIFPDAISTAARRIREAAGSCPYDHRPFLHPGDTDIAAKLTEPFRAGYAAIKWAVAKVIQPRAICEIGVGGGLAALAFLDACPDAAYVGIDNCRYEDDTAVPLLGHVEEQFVALGRRGRILRQDSKSMKTLPGEFDLVHVDGDHNYDACRRDVNLALQSGAPWILVDDARDNQVCAATFAALLAWRPGRTEWTMFEDTWTGSILVYTGVNLR